MLLTSNSGTPPTTTLTADRRRSSARPSNITISLDIKFSSSLNAGRLLASTRMYTWSHLQKKCGRTRNTSTNSVSPQCGCTIPTLQFSVLTVLGLSRQAIFNSVDASLRRLGVDYIDVFQIHRFDPSTPIEETMEALHDLVRSGKVRYIGASSMRTYQFAMMQFCAEKHGWTKFISMQNQYSLTYREEEREMNRFCNDTGVGLIPVRI